MDKKLETKAAYDKYAEKFNQTFGGDFDSSVVELADKFIAQLTGDKILDLGSGPGNSAEYFQNKGLDLLCIDYSEKMIELCRQKGLKAELMDIENLDLPAESFAGIWAIASLLHIPKDKIKQVIAKITELLEPDGILAVGVKEGTGEKMETHPNFPDSRRLFVYFTDEEIKDLFLGKFELVYQERSNFHNLAFFLNYIFKLK